MHYLQHSLSKLRWFGVHQLTLRMLLSNNEDVNEPIIQVTAEPKPAERPVQTQAMFAA